MCSFQEKITFLVCPSQEMSSHFKLHIETFSYFLILFILCRNCALLQSFHARKLGKITVVFVVLVSNSYTATSTDKIFEKNSSFHVK